MTPTELKNFSMLRDKMPTKKWNELADALSVSRITLYKWRKGDCEISPLNRLRINLLCMNFDLDLVFIEKESPANG